eukprot:747458-Hanusia_phi.AAC.5
MGKQSLDIRKKNDRDKKRRKRGRIGDLLRKVSCLNDRAYYPEEHCVSSLTRVCHHIAQRSINEVLRDAAAAVRESRGVSKDKDETAQLKPGALPASVIRDGLLSIKVHCDDVRSIKVQRDDLACSDVHNLQLATQHVTEASYLDEGKRRYLISLRFLQKPMDSCHRDKLKENARSHASKHVKTYDLRPVEVVSSHPSMCGQKQDVNLGSCCAAWGCKLDRRADEILDAIERLAYNMEVADKAFLPMEMADEVDFNGAHKVCKIHADLDPFLVLIRMAEQVVTAAYGSYELTCAVNVGQRTAQCVRVRASRT